MLSTFPFSVIHIPCNIPSMQYAVCSMQYFIQLTAHVTINTFLFFILLSHILAHKGHLQGGYLQRKTFIMYAVQDMYKICAWNMLRCSVINYNVKNILKLYQLQVLYISYFWKYFDQLQNFIVLRFILNLILVNVVAQFFFFNSTNPHSIPNGVIGIFHRHNPSGHTIPQPLTEKSTRNISCGGKGGRFVGLTTLPPSCADCLDFWKLQPNLTLTACLGLSWHCFTFTFTYPQIP